MATIFKRTQIITRQLHWTWYLHSQQPTVVHWSKRNVAAYPTRKPFKETGSKTNKPKISEESEHMSHFPNSIRDPNNLSPEQVNLNKWLASTSNTVRENIINQLKPPMEIFEEALQKVSSFHAPSHYTFVLLYELSYRFGFASVEQVDLLMQSLNKTEMKVCPYIFSSKINAYIKCKKIQEAIQMFEKMCLGPNPKIVPDTLIYNLIISAYMKLNNREKVLETYDTMISSNIKPNMRTLAILIEYFVDCGEISRALDLFEEFESSHEIIDGIVSRKYYKDKNIKTVDSRVMVFNMLLKSLIENSKSDLRFVTKLFDNVRAQHLRAMKEGISTNAMIDTVSYNTLLKAYYDRSQYGEAKKLLEKMAEDIKFDPRLSFTLHTYNTIMHSLTRKGRLNDAIQVFEMMQEKPNSFTYCTLLNGCANTKDLKAAYLIFSKALQNGIVPDGNLCSSMTKVFGECGQLEEALKFIETMKKMNVTPTSYTYTGVFKAFRRKMECDAAFDYYHRIDHPYILNIHLVSSLSHLVRNSKHLEQVLIAYRIVKEKSIILKNKKEFIVYDISADETMKIEAFYKRMLRNILAVGNARQAEEILFDIARTKGMYSNAAADLLKFFLESDDDLDAFNRVDSEIRQIRVEAIKNLFEPKLPQLSPYPTSDTIKKMLVKFTSNNRA